MRRALERRGVSRCVRWVLVGMLGLTLSAACRKVQRAYEESHAQGVRTLRAADRLAVQADLQQIRDAVLQYMADAGQPPPGDIETLMRVLVPRYLPRAVTETHGMPIQYFVEGPRFELRATGPDGRFFTEDDIVVTGP